MADFPDSWVLLPVGEAVQNITITDKKIPQKSYHQTGKYPVIDQGQDYVGGYTDDAAKLVDCQLPVIVFGDHTRVVKLVKAPFAPGADGVKVLEPIGCLVPQLFEYFVRYLVTKIPNHGYARHYQHLAKSLLPIPPLAEQHRIVAKIEELFSELDQGVASLNTAREQLKVYRQSLLKNAFEGKLTAAWREAHRDQLETAEALQQRIARERAERHRQQFADWEARGRSGPKPKTLKPLPPLTAEELAAQPELPQEWIYVRAEEISDFITKGTTPSKELLFSSSGEVPFIKVYNLTMTSALDFSIDPTFVSRETHTGFLARSKVLPGDVLMNIVGPPLGKVSIVPDDYPEWNVNQAIAIFRTKVISTKLLAAYLGHERTVRSMMRKSKATAGQFNLTLEICREIIIPICSREEQRQIELKLDESLSEADQLDQTLATALQQAEALRQSILKKAFSGQLVPQDENDEPAAVLLERIRVKQGASGSGHRRRKNA
ncbi:MAG: hypothetical protein H6R10_3757 [Rhodocyclaceae bacterium]|nr:hypothetical protein [Rhodocyclaceae bacterium]